MKARVCLVVLVLFAAAGGALADDRKACTELSFAPLTLNVPACDRLIAAGGQSNADLYAALMARAEAYRFGLTYRSGSPLTTDRLLALWLGDLDRAVGLARRLAATDSARDELSDALSERAGAEAALGHAHRALGDYSEAIALRDEPGLLDLYGRSLAFERLGQLGEAIADMTAVLRLYGRDPNFASHLVRRAQLHEAAGDKAAAIADYRRALKAQPNHGAAKEALARLGG